MDIPAANQSYGHGGQPGVCHNGWSATTPTTGLGCTAAQGLSSDPLPSLQGLNLGPASHQNPSNNIPQSMVQLQYSHQGCVSSLPTPPFRNQSPSALIPCLNQEPHIPHVHMGPYISYNIPPPSTLLPLKQGPPASGPPSTIPSSNQAPQNTVSPPVSSAPPYPPYLYANQGFVNGPAVTLTSPNQGFVNGPPVTLTSPNQGFVNGPAVTLTSPNQGFVNGPPVTLTSPNQGFVNGPPVALTSPNQGFVNGPPVTLTSPNQGFVNGPPVTLTSPNQGFVNGPPVMLTRPNQGPPNSSFSSMSPCGSQGQQCSHPYPPQLTSPVQQQPQWALPQQHYSHSGVMYKPDATSHQEGTTMQPVQEGTTMQPVQEGTTMQPVQEGTTMQPSCPSLGDSGVSGPSSPISESRYGLHPQLLPSAVRVMEEDRTAWEGKVFVSEPISSLPPQATTDCVVEDRGNCSPRFILSTSYCVPCEGQTALQSHLPLGALVTPLAKLHTGERPLSVCMEADTVKGCGECGAYMCSAMGWQDCGQRFYCPFCGKLREVGWQHYQPTQGVEGNRVDREQRPELSLGSYEILDSQQDVPAAVLLLAVDVSAAALRGGHLELISQQLRSLLTSLNREEGAFQSDVRVGLMTYDSRIHLYDLSPALSRPHMLVVTETEDLQLPVREGLLVPLKDCIDSINSVLQRIPLFSAEFEEASGVLLELPVKTGLAVLQEVGCPGKLLVFQTAPFTEGTHTHNSSGFFSSNKPKSLFQPPDPAVSLAKECVSQGCGVHLFVFSQQDVGGAWPGHVPYLTGGELHCYHGLQGELDRERFSCDLRRTVETETGYRATLRVHVSKDLRVSGCYGSFVPGPNPAHVAMATLDWRTTLAVELTHSRALDEKRGVVVQTVLSYTSQQGERKTRVHSLSLCCSHHLLDTFCNCQAQTLLTFYCKKMYCAVLERPLQELREELQTELTESLACYRKHCSASSVSPGQLVLPQYLKTLPVYLNSLRKSEVLLPGLRSSVHQRLQLRCQVVSMDTKTTAGHFYPLLLPLPVGGNTSSPLSLGEAVRCTAASLDHGGLYLVHGPLVLLLWVGHNVSNTSLVQLFNITCLSTLPSGETKLPVLDNPLSVSVRSLINTLNSQTHYTRKLRVVKQGDSCEEALQRLLVEDKSPNGGASYADFLYHLHVNSIQLLVR
ncbi:protein transport protein Sec24C [Salvelinus fontinalis]|uniref:protein transport protein Sec24C n=1 Tax=Salvelinus fontinalis TaxID=8038 RepID=UPI0024862F3C|nr:protein transport protein Sec24C [Salvelinus fontinalis]